MDTGKPGQENGPKIALIADEQGHYRKDQWTGHQGSPRQRSEKGQARAGTASTRKKCWKTANRTRIVV